MFRTFLRAAALGLCLAGAAPALAEKSFVRDDLASDAVRLETALRTETGSVQGRTADQLRAEAAALLGRGDARSALSRAAAAIAVAPKDAAGWLVYARAALAIEPKDYRERYTLRERATTAAYAAYQAAASKPDEAAALAVLGESYAVREIWRPALNAYRASLALADNSEVRSTYEDLREKHGFRITDYKVDSDSAAPRICFQFSDPVATGKVDFTPFVALSGSANAAVTGEGNQLCVDGLKHGERYAIVVRQGLPSSVGETLLKNADYEIYVRDRSPQVRFTGRNYVLPRTGQEGIPVVSVNTPSVKVDVARVGDRSLLPTVRSEDFLSQLGQYGMNQIANEKGFKVWSGTLDVKTELNKDIVTAFPVDQAVGKLEPGVYVMTAVPASAAYASNSDSEDYSQRATQWFVVSDLGLTALSGDDGVTVYVRSLANAQPLSGVELKLVARNNEVLATKTSDAIGAVRFDPGLARGQGGLAPGLVVAAAGGDYGFLDLQQSAFDLTDRGVEGRTAPGPLDAFLYTERGVYRSGETVFLTALLRDAKGAAVPSLPLTLVVKRPDGVEFRRALVDDQGLGGRALTLPLLSGAQTGTWRVQAFADPKGRALGETTFLVEDYVPERLEVTLTPKAEALRPGEPAEIAVEARYLFGAPGAELDVSGEVTVSQASKSSVPGLEGYAVGIDDEDFEAVTAELEEHATTDAKGKVTVEAPVSEVAAARPVEAKITLRVGELGGRAVERSVTLPILPKNTVVGVKKLFEDLAEGATATFDVVAAEPDGKRLEKSVVWNLYRIDRRYQWYNSDGRWSYEAVKSTRRVADGKLATTADGAVRIAAPVTWGSYRLEASLADPDAQPTSVSFDVGYSGSDSAGTPDVLDVKLDKEAYRAGEDIKLRIGSRFAGTATVSIVADKVYEQRVVDISPDGTTVSLPAKAEWGAGAYAVVFAHRPLDKAAGRMPGRALGLAWFSVDGEAHELKIALDPPKTMRPRGPLTIPVSVTGFTPGEEVFVTVSAVDVGILNLTRYETPDPSEFYFGQRQLSTEVRDLYGFLIDGMQGTRGAIRSGGDATPSLNGEAPTQEPLARYSGVVKVGPDGKANVSFDIPAFNGTVRVAAVAWAKNRVGNASADVIVRDPVVLTPTAPRFLAIGDQSRFFVQIDNVEAKAGDYTFDLDVRGPVVVPADAAHKTLKLEAGGKASVVVPVSAAGPGTASFDVRLTGQGVDTVQTVVLRVQPGTPALVRRTVRALPAGTSVTLSNDLVADILLGTGLVSAAVAPLAALDVPALLAALDRYPYGCTEQTVSRALPLLYVNKLARAEQLALDPDLDKRITGAIERVLARQDSNGSFGLWSVGGDDLWLDAFVTDFLTRAREHNFAVPQRSFDQALDRLRNSVSNTTSFERGKGNDLAYAIYVLARNGRPVMGDLRYLADTKLDDFGSALAQAQIGAALALLGDRGRSQRAFAAALETLRTYRDSGISRADYGSRLRDGAAILALAAEASAGREPIQKAGLAVEQARGLVRYTSTQENAWMVLAAQAVVDEGKGLVISVDGTSAKGTLYRNFTDAALATPVTIANTGQDAAQLVLSVSGNPIVPEPAASQGYVVERTYYKLDGSKADIAQVKQNDRLVVVLKVTENEAQFARLLLVDHLPAGFEIDNPKLVDSGSIEGLSWLKRDVEPVATEYRDDRFVAAFDRDKGQPAFLTVAYIVRAVSPGRYVHPPATVEDMYRPDRFGRTGFGTVEVSAAK